MGSKERMARLKEEIKEKILKAALEIIIEEGCLALSMRKISDRIEYATSTIYEYFINKDAILIALINNGYQELSSILAKIRAKKQEPRPKLIAMWRAYWEFAFTHLEIYKLMFGIGIGCERPKMEEITHGMVENQFIAAIGDAQPDFSSAEILANYRAVWALVHGLISINIVTRPLDEQTNSEILSDNIEKLIQKH